MKNEQSLIFANGVIREFIPGYIDQSSETIKAIKNNKDTIMKMIIGIFECQISGGKILIGGNGGSCADAEHFAGEMTCTFKDPNRSAFNAISLTNNASAITAWANDFGFESYFERQVVALGKPNDILFLLSTGGGDREKGYSMNLVAAADKALVLGLKVYSLVGKKGGELMKISNECIKVPSFETSHIQEAHITIIHAICEGLDRISRSQLENTK